MCAYDTTSRDPESWQAFSSFIDRVNDGTPRHKKKEEKKKKKKKKEGVNKEMPQNVEDSMKGW